MLVDAAINYFGKPYQTMVAIGSLLEHSKQHLGRVWLTLEPRQPEGAESLLDLLSQQEWPVELHAARYFLGWEAHGRPDLLATDQEFRHSIRYEYALQNTVAPFMFLTHNDMLFTEDAIAPLLGLMQTGEYAGAGHIGQCWNCPANAAGVCDSARHEELRLTYEDAVALYRDFPSGRPQAVSAIEPSHPLPLPECRLNEWYALLDVGTYRRETVPHGGAEPIGSSALMDTGIAWYRAMSRRGYRFAHHNGGYRHSWAAGDREGGGHPALFDRGIYDREEEVAREYYEQHYGAPPRGEDAP